MNQHKPSQANRIAALLDDFQPHCSNEMRQMFIADPPRRINDLEEEGYIIKKEYCTLHTYHDGLPKMYTLISRPDQTSRNQVSQEIKPKVEQRAVQPETPRRIENIPPQAISDISPGEFYDIWNQEYYFLKRPPKKAEIKAAIERYKAQKQIHS